MREYIFCFVLFFFTAERLHLVAWLSDSLGRFEVGRRRHVHGQFQFGTLRKRMAQTLRPDWSGFKIRREKNVPAVAGRVAA